MLCALYSRGVGQVEAHVFQLLGLAGLQRQIVGEVSFILGLDLDAGSLLIQQVLNLLLELQVLVLLHSQALL